MAIGDLRRAPYLGAVAVAVMLWNLPSGAVAGEAGNPFETIPPNEVEEIAELAKLATELQDKRRGDRPGQEPILLRGVHPKSHGCVKAEFAVDEDIDEHRRVGLFATPGTKYEAWIRYSNAAVLREDDLKAGDPTKPDERKNGSRGMAIKVLDVEGEMLSQDQGRANQDFLMINTPEFAIANVRDYLRLNRVLMLSERGDVAAPFFLPLTGMPMPQSGDLADIFKDFDEDDRARTGKAFAVITQKIEKQTVRNPLEVQYFGAAPFGFGRERAMKFSAAPCEQREQSAFENIAAGDPSPDYLRDALAATMKGEDDICFNFMIQVQGADKVAELGVEDATTTWGSGEDEVNNYKRVARITIPAPQDPAANEREYCEAMAFSPWHSLAAHRPLGGINRLRQQVYIESAKHREAQGYR
jgi:hypothetical protein